MPAKKWRALGDQFRIDARIVIFEQADSVIAPVAALFRDGRDWAAFVVVGDRAEKRGVELGGRTPIEAWMKNGLAAGNPVIVYPSDGVRDGRLIEVVRKK